MNKLLLLLSFATLLLGNENRVISSTRGTGDEQRTIEYTYNSLDQLISQENPDGITVFYTYYPTGLLATVTSCDGEFFQTFTYNCKGDLIEANDNGHLIQREYDKNILKETFDGRFTVFSNFDESNRPRAIVLSDQSKILYTYNSNELKKITRVAPNGDTRSIDVPFPYKVAVGNLIQENVSEFSYNSLGEIATLSYDLKGNLTENDFWYDALNRLVVTLETSYIYDAFGRRLSKSTWTGHEFYLYYGDIELGAVDIEGNIKNLKFTDPNGKIAAVELDGKLYATALDSRGSIRCLIDPETSEIVEMINYSAFGEEDRVSAPALPWRFAGMRYDTEISTYFSGQRYYNPKLGCWLSLDSKTLR